MKRIENRLKRFIETQESRSSTIKYENQEYYRISHVCRMTGVIKFALRKWTKAGILRDTAKIDLRGWRLYTAEEIYKNDDEAQGVK